MAREDEVSGRKMPARRWYWPLYPSTKVVVTLAVAWLFCAIFPAVEVPHAGMSDGKYGPHFGYDSWLEHGWPLRYCERNGIRPTLTPSTAFGGTWEVAPPWTPWSELIAFRIAPLIIDVIVAAGICLATAVLAQWWRSRRRAVFQVSLLDILGFVGVLGILCAWIGYLRMEFVREERLVNANAARISVERGAAIPAFLPQTIRERYHQLFDRVIEVRLEGDARLASEFKHLLVLSRPWPNRELGNYLRQMPDLEAIDMFMQGLHSDREPDYVGLRDLPPMRKLRGINLYDTDANDDDLEWLAKCHQLERICLINTEVTDAGLRHLSRLAKLRVLDVSSEHLTDACCDTLSRIGGLEELYVGSQHISDAGILVLGRLKGLKRLQLHTSASDSAVNALRTALPGCEVLTGF
jgi:hypothetical protein